MSNLPKSVVINDDTMREGLQIESAFRSPVVAKLRLALTRSARPALRSSRSVRLRIRSGRRK